MALVILALKWVIGPVGRYAAAAALCLAAFLWFRYDIASDAVQAFRAKLLTQGAARVQDAVKADDDARRCSLDPTCRLSNDGWRRD